MRGSRRAAISAFSASLWVRPAHALPPSHRALLIRQLRAHAASILALLANDPATRSTVAPFEGRVAHAAMSGVLQAAPDAPGVQALLSFFASC